MISDILFRDHLKEMINLGKYSYELELKREESLLGQASQMLVTFAFSTAALYALYDVALSHYHTINKN